MNNLPELVNSFPINAFIVCVKDTHESKILKQEMQYQMLKALILREPSKTAKIQVIDNQIDQINETLNTYENLLILESCSQH